MIDFKVADFRQGLSEVSDGSIGCIVTSPRYNQGVKYDVVNDKTNENIYLNEITDLARLLDHKLNEDGSIFVNLPPTELGLDAVRRFFPFFKLQNTFCWVKSFSEDEETSVGHFRPIASPRYVNKCFELVYHLTFNGMVEINRLAVGVTYKDKSNLLRFGHKEDKRCAGNVWFIPMPTTQKGSEHPAEFPVDLPRKCLLLHGVEKNPFVVDPFCGTGATLLAAKELGLSGLGIDISERYIELAKERLIL